MVQQIITAFRAKHKFNLSNERLKAYAEKWQSKIEDENAIETFIDGLDTESLEEIARLDDALRVKTPKVEEPKPKDDEPKEPANDIQKQINELKELLNAKAKSDLSATRLNELKDLPNELKASLKFVPLENLSDDDFTALKTDLNTQAEALKLAQSKTNPRFGVEKKEGNLTADEKRYLESKSNKKS